MFFLIIASNVSFIENSTWEQNLTPARFGAMVLGDIDNDGDLDIISTGCLNDGQNDCEGGVITKVYINNGTTLNENLNWQQNLTGVGLSSLALGDIDNDGDLDLALTGCDNSTNFNCYGNRVAKIYINNGTSFVENQIWQQSLSAVTEGSLAFGDVNNDGKLDLAQIGANVTLPYLMAKIYINNGSSLIESPQWQGNLTGVQRGDIAFGDIDNDGKLDLVLSGDKETITEVTKIYVNNGTSLIENRTWQQNLTQMDDSSVLLGDYDNDGDLDLVMNGHTTGDRFHIYNNNGTALVLNQTDSVQGGVLLGLYSSSIAFGDIDNDGDLDLVGMGWERGRTRIYENNNSIFQNDATAHLNISDDLYMGSLAFGDIDNDRDLDLSLFGYEYAQGLKARVYLSNASLTKNNTLPTPPDTFTSSYVNNQLVLTWNNGSDAETNSTGLYYNLRVGNSTNNHSVVSGVYGGESGSNEGGGGGANGYFGNMMQRRNITLNVQLEANKTYNWYVQTIDTGLAKSNWSVMQSFNTSLDTTKPNVTLINPSPNGSLHTTNPYFAFNASVIDANVTNVTLYADWTGSMIINQTNLSGINANYTFTRNLTNYNDGVYNWYIYACDGDNNCQTSGIRSFYLDRNYPLVYSESPANVSTWSSSSTVTFSYNVTDTDIANCSLIINNAVDQTDDSISEGTSQTFTKTLSNGDYTWSVNCTDYINYANSSGTRGLTVSYTAPPGSGGPGSGGGGGTITPTNKTIQKFDVDFSNVNNRTLEVKQGDIKTFSFNGEIKHSITLITITTDSMTLLITSDPITIQVNVGETKQIDINNDKINDFEIKLVSILNGKASFSLLKLSGADIVAGEELEKEALFDVKVSLADKFKEVLQGEEITATIEVFNVNNIGQVDVTVNYYLIDKDNITILSQGTDVAAVEAVTSFIRTLKVPENTKSGTYYFGADIKYDNLTISGRAEFRVTKLKIGTREMIIFGAIIFLIIAGAISYLIIKRRERELEKKEAVLERIVKGLKRERKFGGKTKK